MRNRISKHGKGKLYVLLVTVILLILSSLLYMFYSARFNNQATSTSIYISIALVSFGLVTITAVYLKQRVRSKNVKRLNDDFFEAYESINEYIGLSPISLLEKQEIKGELLALFLEAQQNGKNSKQVIGDDYNQFAKDMLGAYGVRNSIFIDILSGLQFFIVYIFLVTTFLFIEGESSFYNIKIDYTILFLFAVTSFIILPLAFSLKRKAIGKDNFRSYMFSIIVGIGVSVSFIAIIMRILRKNLKNIAWIKEFLDGGMVLIKSPYHLVLLLLVIPSITFIKRSLRNSAKR